MKNIYFILFIFLFIISCEDFDNQNVYDGEKFVFFNEATIDVNESSTVPNAEGSEVASNAVVVTVSRAAHDVSDPLTVTLEVSSMLVDDEDSDAEGTYSTSLTSSDFIIPAGEYSETFTIYTVSDEVASGDKLVTVQITGVSDPTYSIGFQGETSYNSSINVKIIDDDCPVAIENLTGTFDVIQTDLHDKSTLEYQVTITQDDINPLLIYIDGLVSNGFGTVHDMIVPLTLVTCSKVAIYPSAEPMGFYSSGGSTGPVTIERYDSYFTGEPGPVFAENGYVLDPNDAAGWVSYDDATGKITIYGWIRVVGLGSFGGFVWDLSKSE